MARIDDWRRVPLTPEEEATIEARARAYIMAVPPGPDVPAATVEKAVQSVIKTTREWVKIGKWREIQKGQCCAD